LARKLNDKGMALVVVIVVVIMLALLAGYVTQLGYNQRRLSDTAGGRRAKIYYNAQAGVVHANWRIRTNYTAGLVPAGSFLVDAYDPNPYSIDVDGDGTMDCTVDIGPVAAGRRSISATGLDV
jgi:Tfp pilus assembly protein PilX